MLSYTKKMDTKIEFWQSNKLLLSWPKIPVAKSRLAFKSMVDYFLDWSIKDTSKMDIKEYYFFERSMIPAINKTVEIIDKLYQNIARG